MHNYVNQPNVFQGDLLADEKILWQVQPDRSVIFNKSDIFAIPFGLIWLGIMFYSLFMYYVHGVSDATVTVNGSEVASSQLEWVIA